MQAEIIEENKETSLYVLSYKVMGNGGGEVDLRITKSSRKYIFPKELHQDWRRQMLLVKIWRRQVLLVKIWMLL